MRGVVGMKKEFKTPAIETRAMTVGRVMDDDLAVFANSPGQSLKRDGVDMTDTVSQGYNAWRGFGK